MKMKILHISQNSNGYEEVELVANRVSRKNSLAVIRRKNGEIFYTGGFLINDTPSIRKALDGMTKEEQYEFVNDFKVDPFVKFYQDETEIDLELLKNNGIINYKTT